MLPDFIHIGPGRSGTTFLYEMLKQHPEVYLSEGTKETNFFSLFYDKGLDWYEQFYPEPSKKFVKGEISNRYFYTPEVPKRIKETIPNVKLFTVLRNPYYRTISVFQSLKQRGEIDYYISFKEALVQYPEILRQNRVGEHLNRYLKYFGKNQLKVFFYDDLLQNPEKFLKELYNFIGVDYQFLPNDVHDTINPAQNIRFPVLRFVLRKGADLLRKLELLQLLNAIKNSSLVEKLFFKEDDDYQKQKETYLRILFENHRQTIESEITQVEEILEVSLKNWYLHEDSTDLP